MNNSIIIIPTKLAKIGGIGWIVEKTTDIGWIVEKTTDIGWIVEKPLTSLT